jgi:hypothetical protein
LPETEENRRQLSMGREILLRNHHQWWQWPPDTEYIPWCIHYLDRDADVKGTLYVHFTMTTTKKQANICPEEKIWVTIP